MPGIHLHTNKMMSQDHFTHILSLLEYKQARGASRAANEYIFAKINPYWTGAFSLLRGPTSSSEFFQIFPPDQFYLTCLQLQYFLNYFPVLQFIKSLQCTLCLCIEQLIISTFDLYLIYYAVPDFSLQAVVFFKLGKIFI